jgi:thymidylate synthase (FAD)
MIKVTYDDHMGSDLSVVNKARVSFGKKSNWANADEDFIMVEHYGGMIRVKNPRFVGVLSNKDAKLIKYLAEHKHMSPFGHAFASFHVKAPIFVARQLVKHKFLRWNEISRRYVDDEPEFYIPDVWRGRSEDKKQGSDGVVTHFNTTRAKGKSLPLSGVYKVQMEAMHDYYKDMIEGGVAPEQARMVLPQSTMTEWHWSGSLDALADMCKLRCKEDTQYETRLVADQISEKMKQLFPVSWVALVGEQKC